MIPTRLRLLVATCAFGGCASLSIPLDVAAPELSGVDARGSELRLLAPSEDRPADGAVVRLWSRIHNPNAFGLSITTIAGDLHLGDGGSVRVDFPLGLPLEALADTVVPLDVSVGFDDVPVLGTSLIAAALEGALDYRLEATIAVDAGLLGQPTFGPLTALAGTLRIRR